MSTNLWPVVRTLNTPSGCGCEVIGRTVRLEEGLNGVLLRTRGMVILRHDFPWLEMEAVGPFWVAGNVICPLKDLYG